MVEFKKMRYKINYQKHNKTPKERERKKEVFITKHYKSVTVNEDQQNERGEY